MSMYRNWKSAAALGLALLLGCMMPMSTMLAAEDDAGTEVCSDADAGMTGGDESAPENENTADVENEPEDEDAADGENKPEDENVPDVETTPEIFITRDGKESTCSLGGKITFEYIRNWGPQVEVTVSQSDHNMSVFWAKDKVTDMEAEAKTEEQMSSLRWYEKEPSETILLAQDGSYVIYVKVTSGEKNYYARSNGIVVDTQKPVIKGVEEGKTYPEGTAFQVEDANLDRVLVNEQPAVPEGGNYKVAANGTSCVIRAIDKAGNETACSITVLTEEKPETDHVISQSGVYALKAGEKYHLAQGQWKVDGDKSVYQGGNDFYVSADGNYSFAK